MASLDDGPLEPAAVQLTISFDESLSTLMLLFISNNAHL